MPGAFDRPVLFLIYRRPDTTRQVFEAIRSARPRRLYVAAAGPLSAGETALCEETRAIVDGADWSCEVIRNFRTDNLGCSGNTVRAISWVLDHEEEAVIIEDDCVPSPSFFPYCAELLDRYRDDQRVMSICGSNTVFGRQVTADSYFFSRYPNTWGWAVWRRAWRFYDREIALWPRILEEGWMEDLFDRRRPRVYWTLLLDLVHRKAIDFWDFAWYLTCWLQNALAVQPAVSLVRNVGVDHPGGTHMARSPRLSRLEAEDLRFPLRHPPVLVRNARADDLIEWLAYAHPRTILRLRAYWLWQRLPPGLKRALRSALGRGRG